MLITEMPRPDFMRSGQPYWRVGARLHRTRDGREIALDVWASFCADCGEPFHCSVVEDRDPEVRRCEAHRASGSRVGKSKPRRAAEQRDDEEGAEVES